MKRTLPGEIWWVDFGLAAKARPALILSDFPKDDELAMLVVIPHTTAVRGNRWELKVPKPLIVLRRQNVAFKGPSAGAFALPFSIRPDSVIRGCVE
jgi:hypothetical protein